jgi:hypothetical protein
MKSQVVAFCLPVLLLLSLFFGIALRVTSLISSCLLLPNASPNLAEAMAKYSPWSLLALAFSLTAIPHATASGETGIWINEIPLYSSLAPCALSRVSAIIRAQASGCNDDSAHTSFACFCVDSSSAFSSIISTAVAQECSRQETVATGTADVGTANVQAQVTAAPLRRGAAIAYRQVAATTAQEVASALEVWESYCAKSTMLSKCKPSISLTTISWNNSLTTSYLVGPTSTPYAPATVTITQAPQTVTVTPPPSSSGPSSAVLIPAILVPALFVALISIVGAWLYVRRSRSRTQQQMAGGVVTNKLREKDGETHITELAITEEQKTELADGERGAYGLEHHHRAELPSGAMSAGRNSTYDGRSGQI